MRFPAKLASTLLALVTVIVACGGSDGNEAAPPPGDGPRDGDTITPAYCTQYCSAKSNEGTLGGSRAECFAACCTNVAGGCPEPDAGPNSASDAGIFEAGVSDGSVCARPCGGACCAAGEGCGRTGNGTPTCVKSCRTGAECESGCCAPALDTLGAAVGPYVCKPNDGAAYNCCNGFQRCGSPNCCVRDELNNRFCAQPCQANGQCGSASCLGGFAFDGLYTTCAQSNVCAPPRP